MSIYVAHLFSFFNGEHNMDRIKIVRRLIFNCDVSVLKIAFLCVQGLAHIFLRNNTLGAGTYTAHYREISRKLRSEKPRIISFLIWMENRVCGWFPFPLP